MPAEPIIQISGPWTHRSVTANGTRFHLASMGEGPLVLLLHGFPEFWWTWRHQLVTLAEAGYRAVAVDLRGYGGSDKPPRGYDLITAAADAAGLIRALGEANAAIVGHDWGGLAAWTLAAYFPKAVRRLAVVSMAHPLHDELKQAMLDRLGEGHDRGWQGHGLHGLPRTRSPRRGTGAHACRPLAKLSGAAALGHARLSGQTIASNRRAGFTRLRVLLASAPLPRRPVHLVRAIESGIQPGRQF